MKKFKYDYVIKTSNKDLISNMSMQFERNDNVIDMSFVDGRFGSYDCEFKDRFYNLDFEYDIYVMTIQSDEMLGLILSRELLTGYEGTDVDCVEIENDKPHQFRSFVNMFEEGLEI